MSNQLLVFARRWLAVLAAFLLLGYGILSNAQEPAKESAPASESNPSVPAAGHSLHGETFDDGPRQAAQLLPGMGAVSFPITTGCSEAQAFFTQGVAQLHTFYYLEAERSFRQAAALDPECPMTLWGMAMANVNNEKRAKGFLEELAKKPLDQLTKRETLYLDALKALYAKDGDEKSHRRNYIQGLETIVQDFPDDLEARAFLALATWQTGQKDGFNSRQTIEEMLRSIERDAPLHPAVHHYRIHLWDDFKPAQALKSAGLYAQAVPGIAHAWHMPGHTYDGLKRYSDSAFQQEGSARVDHASMARDRIMPFEIHNYAHNNQWLATSLARVGRARDAITMARNLVEQPHDPQKNTNRDGGSCQRSGRARWSEVLVKYELWDELIDATLSGALDWSDQAVEKKDRALTLGLAYANRGEADRLAEQLEALRSLKPPAPEKAQAESTKPEDAKPDAPEDEAVEEEVSDDTKADDSKPDEAKPDEAKPAEVKPEAAKPDEAKPEAAKPDEAKPEAAKPEAAKPDEAKPEAAKPDTAAEAPKPARPRRRRTPTVPGLDPAIAELELHQLLLQGKTDEARTALEKAAGIRKESQVRLLLKLDQKEKAESVAREAVKADENQYVPLACLVETLAAVGKVDEAREQYTRLLELAPRADRDLPVAKRLDALATTWTTQGWSTAACCEGDEATSTRASDLTTLGPLIWSPYAAEPIRLVDTKGETWDLSEHRGRNVVILFFLGGSCAHCMQQLALFGKAMEDLQALDADLVAISTDDPESARLLKQNQEGVDFPMPMLADPELATFRLYRSVDDFEKQPLHGTILVDRKGDVRFQRISAEPFLDIEFVKRELSRMNRLSPAQAQPQ